MGVFLGTPPGSRKAKREKPPTGGQGRRLDVEAKDMLERHAEDLAARWCKARGWSDIERVGNKKAWDLEGLDGRRLRRYVEVRGTTGGLGAVEVTAGEVNAARTHGDSHLMIVVSEILLDFEGGQWRTGGGVLQVIYPWRPLDVELTPLRFKWKPSRAEHGRQGTSVITANADHRRLSCVPLQVVTSTTLP